MNIKEKKQREEDTFIQIRNEQIYRKLNDTTLHDLVGTLILTFVLAIVFSTLSFVSYSMDAIYILIILLGILGGSLFIGCILMLCKISAIKNKRYAIQEVVCEKKMPYLDDENPMIGYSDSFGNFDTIFVTASLYESICEHNVFFIIKYKNPLFERDYLLL